MLAAGAAHRKSASSGAGFAWTKSQPGFLQNCFASVPLSVVALVEAAWAEDAMLPFRRREFEVDALAQEIARRAGCASAAQGGTVWGGALPTGRTARVARCDARRCVYPVYDRTSARCEGAAQALRQSLAATATHTAWACPPSPAAATGEDGALLASASHAVVLLSAHALDEGSDCLRRIASVVASGTPYVFLYFGDDGEDGFSFAQFYRRPIVGASAAFEVVAPAISGCEALQWRPNGGRRRYEHDALVLELLKRLRPVA